MNTHSQAIISNLTVEKNTVADEPSGGRFFGFDHVHFWVGNALQVAGWYCVRFGFEYYAYRGLETGNRDVATHVIKNNDGVIFAFSSPYTKDKEEMHRHQAKHGDGVKDAAFRVEDSRAIFQKAVSRGALPIMEPQELRDEHGSIIISSVQTYGDVIHTFVQRNEYKGFFMPGYVRHPKSEPINKLLPSLTFQFIDHIAGNQGEGEMEPVATWYEKHLDFHRYFSVDDTMIHSQYSALNATVMADAEELVKLTISEPAHGQKISQIQEYIDYHGGPGVQHIALRTDDIIREVEILRQRGVDFLGIPDNYYDNLRKNIPHMNIKIKEDIDVLQRNKILVDYDDQGYLLQIFTKPVEDRPTLFFEVIQRCNHKGFGAGNFKSLYVSIEEEQKLRGNLLDNPYYVSKQQ